MASNPSSNAMASFSSSGSGSPIRLQLRVSFADLLDAGLEDAEEEDVGECQKRPLDVAAVGVVLVIVGDAGERIVSRFCVRLYDHPIFQLRSRACPFPQARDVFKATLFV